VPVGVGLDDREHARARRHRACAVNVRGERGEIDLSNERAGHARNGVAQRAG
jgi:hypothetical protein